MNTLMIPMREYDKPSYIINIKNKYNDKYKIFIETGTYLGRTVIEVSKYFDMVHTIELKQDVFDASCNNIKKTDLTNIKLHCGDSREILPKILETITRPCVFWLDAHYHQPTAPLMKDLETIHNNIYQENAIILIDDIRELTKWGCPNYNKVVEICKNYWPTHNIYGINDIIHILPQGSN